MAEDLPRESAARNTHSVVFRLLRERVPQGAVLDIPCGSGSLTYRLREAGYCVTSSDLVEHPCLRDAEFKSADMNEPLPFEAGSFDAVVCIEGIEHIQRPFDFVRECHRVLRRPGILIITTPNTSSMRSRWRHFLTGFHNKCKYPLDEAKPEPRHHINMRSFPELRYMLHTNGFAIETVAANGVKPISWVYLPWAPVVYAASSLAFPRGAKNEAHRRQIAQVLRQMMTVPVLFGESLILVAAAR